MQRFSVLSPRAGVSVMLGALLLAGCAHTSLPPEAVSRPGLQKKAGLAPARLADIDRAIEHAVAEGRMPGAVFHLEHGAATHTRAYGRLSDVPAAAPVTLDTVFDVASLSKVLSTAPSVLMLAEEGSIDLEAPLVRYFPQCAGGGKEAITIRQLLTHSSGLPASLPAKPAWQGKEAALALACAREVTHAPGTFFRYSDVNYILLGLLVEKVSGKPLDQFARERIFTPLGMHSTGYQPLARIEAARIAPTQRGPQPAQRDKSAHGDVAPGALLQGVVHDPTIRRMGGVGGSAGVFSTVGDVARFGRMLLAGGELDGVRVLSKRSVELLTTVQSPSGIPQLRAMGMDIDSPYAKRPRGDVYPVGSYGHTGFTGCVLWVDPATGSFYVFLSNRVYPDDSAVVLPLYTQMGTLSAQAARE